MSTDSLMSLCQLRCIGGHVKKSFLSLCMVIMGLMVPALEAVAGCNPCVCGPGGDYKGDTGQWFRENCGTNGPNRPNPPPKNPRIPGNFSSFSATTSEYATCTWDSLNCPENQNCQVEETDGPFLCVPK